VEDAEEELLAIEQLQKSLREEDGWVTPASYRQRKKRRGLVVSGASDLVGTPSNTKSDKADKVSISFFIFSYCRVNFKMYGF
jgi:hypothetical protein